MRQAMTLTRTLAALALIFAGAFAARAATFDGERAMELLRAQCEFGPRVPGTTAHEATARWIAMQLRGLGLHVVEQEFEVELPINGRRVRAVNIWGVPAQDGPSSPALVLSAHWDTRPHADRDRSGRNPPMLGANDGASGVAAALELYRALGEDPLRRHVALAFWDVEDAGVQQDMMSWALGARHAAANPPAWIGRVVHGINLDMVAGHDLRLQPEAHSRRAAPGAVEEIWRLGRMIAPARFSARPGNAVTDDHLPWIEAGVPWVNLIGLPYEHWHTVEDRPENCSVESMQSVGNVVLHYIRRGGWRK